MFSIGITSRKIWYRSLHTKHPAAVFLETQKEHSVSLYSLSVTTAKPIVYSIFANRHNYHVVKYKLNYAMARTFRVTVRWQMWQCLGICRNNNWVSQYTENAY